jgi:NADH:ubiquinone oxidoreductase subunit 2 (subunit N)
MESTTTIRLSRLHGMATTLDLVGLALVLLQAWFLVPPAEADHWVLLMSLCVVPIAMVVFFLVPRRAGLQAETHTERRSLLVYATLGVPVLVSLLTLLLVWAAHSFDSFAGFALLIAADAGRNLCEWLRNR